MKGSENSQRLLAICDTFQSNWVPAAKP